MVAMALLRNTVCIDEKKLFPAISYSNLQGKKYSLRTTTLLWITVFSYELLFH